MRCPPTNLPFHTEASTVSIPRPHDPHPCPLSRRPYRRPRTAASSRRPAHGPHTRAGALGWAHEHHQAPPSADPPQASRPKTRPSLTALAALTLAAFGGARCAGRLSHATGARREPLQRLRTARSRPGPGREPVCRAGRSQEGRGGRHQGNGARARPALGVHAAGGLRLFQSDTEGKFGGVGVEVDLRDDAITVIAPIEGSPAERAGIRSGDRIVAVDGQGARGEPLDKLVRKLRGAPGTKVQIGVRRAGSDSPLTFDWCASRSRSPASLASA